MPGKLNLRRFYEDTLAKELGVSGLLVEVTLPDCWCGLYAGADDFRTLAYATARDPGEPPRTGARQFRDVTLLGADAITFVGVELPSETTVLTVEVEDADTAIERRARFAVAVVAHRARFVQKRVVCELKDSEGTSIRQHALPLYGAR
jgi:hypothetical protein